MKKVRIKETLERGEMKSADEFQGKLHTLQRWINLTLVPDLLVTGDPYVFGVNDGVIFGQVLEFEETQMMSKLWFLPIT